MAGNRLFKLLMTLMENVFWQIWETACSLTSLHAPWMCHVVSAYINPMDYTRNPEIDLHYVIPAEDC